MEIFQRFSNENVVIKYEKDIVFMLDKDKCFMQAVEPRNVWVLALGYEVAEDVLAKLADALLCKPIDPKEDRFGTFSKLSSRMLMEPK